MYLRSFARRARPLVVGAAGALFSVCLWGQVPLVWAFNADPQGPVLPPSFDQVLQKLDRGRFKVAPAPSALGFDVDKSTVAGWKDFAGRRGGTWRLQTDKSTGTLLLAEGSGLAWVPGSGNNLPPARGANGNGRGSTLDDVAAVASAFVGLEQGVLQAPAANLILDRKASVGFGKGNRYWTLRYDFVVPDPVWGAIPVRDAYLFFRINHGNLVQFGNHLAVAPKGLDTSNLIARKEVAASASALFGNAADLRIDDAGKSVGQNDRSLLIVPVSQGQGQPLSHQLVRALSVSTGDLAYELWFDAHTGALVNAIDLVERLDGAVTAGIYPVTNTDPMVVRALPYVSVSDGVSLVTDLAGKYDYTPATVASAGVDGPYVHIVDSCGPTALSTSLAPGDLSFGAATGTDCAQPGYGGAGNTNAARSAYYHLNLIKEKARRFLNDPVVTTPWLDASVTTNVNRPSYCNAGWSPGAGTLNFYQSTATCSNTGEISAVFLHEFGHGLDQNTNGAPPEKGSGEAYGDTMAFLQTHQSCIGHNFKPGVPCLYGCDATCTGVRNVGITPKVTPSTIQSGPANCLVNSGGTCPYIGYEGPMGYEGHCESLVASGAMWDLAQGLVAAYGEGAGWALTDRLWYESLYATGSAYQVVSGGQCNPAAAVDGCGSDNWYTVLLGIDDDDGNLANGTPNAATLWSAFNGHGIACGASAPPTSSTCTPPAAANPLSATAASGAVDLSWATVPGATSYKVFRNEFGCSAGSTPIAEVVAPATSFHDTSVHAGTTYYYGIQTVGASDTCVSAFTTCQSALPTIPLTPANLVMVLDQSGSMSEPTDLAGETKIVALRNAAQMVIDAAGPYAADGVRVGAVSFASTVTGNTGLKNPGDLTPGGEHDQLLSFVNGLSPTTATAIGAGINDGLTVFPAASSNQKVLMLLSDGIQNVAPNLAATMSPPGASVGGTALPADVRFFTVALGTNVQHALFDALATDGGIPGFYYSGGTTAVQSNFAFWLGSALGLGAGTPFSLTAGSGSGFDAGPPGVPILVNRSVRRLTVLVTWHGGATPHLMLQAPNGDTFSPPAGAYNAAAGYVTYTVAIPPSPAGDTLIGTWVAQVTSAAGTAGAGTYDLYTLFDDGAIRTAYTVGGSDPAAGEALPVTVKLSEFGVPLRGQKVYLRMARPGQSLGDVLSDAVVTADQLASVQPPKGDVFANDAQRKLAYLLKTKPGLFGQAPPNAWTLSETSPGIYQAVLTGSATTVPGTYTIELAVEGQGVFNAEFDRVSRFSRYLRVKPNPTSTPVTASVTRTSTTLKALITLTPRDRFGHRLGPGWADALTCKVSNAKVDGRVTDLLNGAYTLSFSAPATSDPQVTCDLMSDLVVNGRLSQFTPTQKAQGISSVGLAAAPLAGVSALAADPATDHEAAEAGGGCAVGGTHGEGALILGALVALGARARRRRNQA